MKTPWVALLACLLAMTAAGCGPHPVEPPRTTRFLPITADEGDNAHAAGPWRYVLMVRAKDTRSETRAGQLLKDDQPVVGAAAGETLETPWGAMKWLGPPPEPMRIRPPYEFGWLARGTYDRPLE
jgi:hypothetical protein